MLATSPTLIAPAAKIADTKHRLGTLIHEQGWGDAASEDRLARGSRAGNAIEAANGVPVA